MERLYTLIGFQIKLTPIENSVPFTDLAENSKSNIPAKEMGGYPIYCCFSTSNVISSNTFC